MQARLCTAILMSSVPLRYAGLPQRRWQVFCSEHASFAVEAILIAW
jgi:hypothetical protein